MLDIRIMMVEIAAIVGSMKSRSAANMCLVSVAFKPPETKIEMMTSSNEVRVFQVSAVCPQETPVA